MCMWYVYVVCVCGYSRHASGGWLCSKGYVVQARRSAKQEKPEIESHKLDVSDKEVRACYVKSERHWCVDVNCHSFIFMERTFLAHGQRPPLRGLSAEEAVFTGANTAVQPDSDDEGAVLQRVLALTGKSAAEKDASSEAKRAVASNAASMSSASSQTGGLSAQCHMHINGCKFPALIITGELLLLVICAAK